MKVLILGIGKTNESYLDQGILVYQKRLVHYTNLELLWLPDIKKFSDPDDLMEKEGEQFLKTIQNDDYVILCDEKGKAFTSKKFSALLEQRQVESTKRLVLVIGGAFGLSRNIRQRANLLLSLSEMTFSHQMIRLFLIEQVYRAYTIIKNEKYHNE